MSLLSDLLSKIKHPEPRKDVPPGLRNTISGIKKKELNKRRIIILSVFVAIVLSSVFVTAYLAQTFLTGEVWKGKGEARKITEVKEDLSSEQTDRNVEVLPTPSVKTEKPFISTATEKPLITMVKPGSRKKEKPKRKSSPSIERKPLGIPEIVNQKEIPKAKDVVGEQVDSSSEIRNSEMKEVYLYMGESYEKKGDNSNAISSYKKVLDIEPKNYKVMNKIAYIFIRIASHREALKYLENALDIRQDYVPVLINAGTVYAKEEKFTDAEKYLLKALSIEEVNQTALFNLALLYEKQGRYDLAQQYYSRLKGLGNKEGRLGLERISGR